MELESKSQAKRIAIQQQAEIARLRAELREAVEYLYQVLDGVSPGAYPSWDRHVRAFIERNKEGK